MVQEIAETQRPASQPPKTSLLQNLTTQSLLLNHLFTLLSSLPSPQTAPQISQVHAALQLSAIDISGLVKGIGRHQEAWSRFMAKKEEVEGLEKRVRSMIRRLEEGRTELEEMIDLGNKQLEAIEQAEREPISVKTLMAHARSLAKHSSAPVSNLILPVDKDQYVPWPSENVMRMGLLFKLSGSMSGAGQFGNVYEEQHIRPQQHDNARQPEQQEESSRKYDPDAVFQLDLNSDDSDDD
ncbi:hypothetical protein L204_103065 [Cryptococcus depauperatus]|nr:hypothetical protein L204_00186 [Cryptococcus depauperatus CBS 7855]